MIGEGAAGEGERGDARRQPGAHALGHQREPGAAVGSV
jgi:hypothetical protein